jgi:hypothetical protein
LDQAVREKLETLAVERLNATADDEEPWSFCFRTEGCVGLLYCPWSETEDWEFDGETKGLDLSWSAERLDRISRGEDDPTHEELQQWRRAKWRKLTASSPTWFAWIVPLRIDQDIAGYALFVGDLDGDPEEAPYLRGVLDSFEEAKAELATEGSVDDTVEGREAPQV